MEQKSKNLAAVDADMKRNITTIIIINRYEHIMHITTTWHIPYEIPQQEQSFYGPLSSTTRLSRYQKKHSPTHTYPNQQPSIISLFHLLRSTASCLFNLRAWQPFCTTSLQVPFGLPRGLEPSTSCSIHFFTQQLLYSLHLIINDISILVSNGTN